MPDHTTKYAHLVKLREVAERALAEGHVTGACSIPSVSTDATITTSFHEVLVAELDVGWDRVASVSDDMRRIDIKCIDTAKRAHLLTIYLSSDHPQSAPKSTRTCPH